MRLSALKNLQKSAIGTLGEAASVGPYSISQKRLASGVGLTAIGLPIVLLLSAWMEGNLRDSISHYYYGNWQGGVFIAMLTFIGTFLIAYEGKFEQETILARCAGAFALGVALFPTSGAGFEDTTSHFRSFGQLTTNKSGEWSAINAFVPLNQLADWIAWLHVACASGLFLFLLYYSFVIFPAVQLRQRVNQQDDAEPISQKKLRNTMYYITGLLILISMTAIASQSLWGEVWNKNNLTFWFEALALISFGVAWTIKGRVIRQLQDPDE